MSDYKICFHSLSLKSEIENKDTVEKIRKLKVDFLMQSIKSISFQLDWQRKKKREDANYLNQKWDSTEIKRNSTNNFITIKLSQEETENIKRSISSK